MLATPTGDQVGLRNWTKRTDVAVGSAVTENVILGTPEEMRSSCRESSQFR